ncbi:Zn-dependent protease (includes SpoIVFB) [Sphingomonas guangdongensis]|uniref:Zn-dependent protease (Includes SpoIVFB) n=1 Tax=Sphingomonas guangdongensis TaxID=1141890 RepID=A0A285QY51_9SPHN|nr:site-2 protease family protein [Sphingomonas guangdongensis]SOB86484.1 Zn-dependent protease (includes SpoIVFB) [Sphingomonas guangdongensis]
MSADGLPWRIASWLIPLVVAIVFHEVAHGWVARAFGDPTAARLGRLSLNPIRHVDPIGTVALPLLLAVTGAPVFGWAKPVPVVARRLRHPRVQMMLVALAGPGINLALAAVTVLLLAQIGGGEPPGGVAGQFVLANLFNFLLINVFLAIFNLIPLPPFDGGHVVEGLLPRSAVPAWQRLARFAFPILILLLLVIPMLAPQLNVVGRVVAPIAWTVIRTLLGAVGLA